MRIIQAIGMLSGIIMLLFNIPLILRIIRRRSSGDISLVWVIGVWSCRRHAAVKLAVSGSSSSSIRDHQLALFLGSLFHRSLLSSGGQKNEQSWFVNVYESLQNL
jgi:hypothetical protein